MRVRGTSPDGISGARRPGSLRHVHARARRAALTGALTLVLVAVASSTASAVLMRVGGRTLSYQPVRNARALAPSPIAPAASSPVEYHGGPVMSSNTNYTLYWDPAGSSSYPAGYQAVLDSYFENLAHDSGGLQNTDSLLTQYGDSLGEFASYDSHFGGDLVDTQPYPANGCSAAAVCLTDEQIRTELTHFVEAGKLPIDLQHEYFVLTPPGVEACFEAASRKCSAGTAHSAFCAYHGYIPVGNSALVYADDPYLDGLNCDLGEEHPNNNPADSAIGGGVAHEHSESLTDPAMNAWHDAKGNEVGDKCRTFKAATEYGEPLGKAPDGSNYNQVINGALYWFQQEWSNEAGGCAQRQAQHPVVRKLAPKSGKAIGGTKVTISGLHFLSPATVSFGGTPATAVTVNSPSSIIATSPAGTVGTVEVTVSTVYGDSAATKSDHFKYKR
jgi:hypothetical protein